MPATPAPEPFPDDPRPVFEGDWAKADGQARSAHRTRVNAWYQRHPEERPSAKGDGKGGGKGAKGGGDAQSRMDAGNGRHERHERQDANLATLRRIQAMPDAHASDVIRAVEAEQRILERVEQEQRAEQHGPLLALRDALSAIPEAERVGALDSLLRVEG